jgi:hypothetical protein
MPARCSLPESEAFAASTAPGSIVKAYALLEQRLRRMRKSGTWTRNTALAPHGLRTALGCATSNAQCEAHRRRVWKYLTAIEGAMDHPKIDNATKVFFYDFIVRFAVPAP